MKITGKFLVVITDGMLDQHHPNGWWSIARATGLVAASKDVESSRPYGIVRADGKWAPLPTTADFAVRARLASVRTGDKINAESYSGRTGVSGEILSRSGNNLIVDGEAWGAYHSATNRDGKLGFSTHTFEVRAIDTFYAGSLVELRGMRVDSNLIQRMERLLNESHSSDPFVCGHSPVTPFWQ